ncbi:SCO4225 family membrane protein [Haloglycomyces albus]|uniref:SCO4225 family membrane protein n=1 Tax=Haloglycomyces albus TaxID=526067 RepID=UPI00046D1765|nr:hypothetical protein [Haloglycomyces albus]
MPRLHVEHWITGVYIALLLLVAFYTVVATEFDASGLAGVWLVLLTAPTSYLIFLTPVTGLPALVAYLAAGMFQAVVMFSLLGSIRRHIAARRHRKDEPPPGLSH